MKIMHGIVPLIVVISPAAAMAATPCEQLVKTALPNTKIDLVKSTAAGDLTIPPRNQGGRTQNIKDLPAFCRVAVTMTPAKDSDIKAEVWLPMNWNGKFQAVGNGGWAGTISYGAMAGALRAGYATASTDTGHSTSGGSFQFAHPDKLLDYDWRSVREMTLKAKALITAFYGNGPKFSYWNGCSTGGRQGLVEATRFPNDYDGIVVGDPANGKADRNTWQMMVTYENNKSPAYNLPVDKLKVLHAAVMNACDMLDGVKDGILENPRACHFDPAVLTCKGADAPDCLTKEQMVSVKRMLSPGKLKNGAVYQPGLELGSEIGPYPGRELGWAPWAGYINDPPPADFFRFEVYRNPDWNWKTFDVETAYPLAQKTNAEEPALPEKMGPFFSRGGKMIMYHGWADPSVAPQETLDFYTASLKTSPKAAQDARLFMVPGMGHCGGGEGATSTFDKMAALENWVEKGQAPARIEASHMENGKVTRTRPLCPYPQWAHYKGTGSTDDAVNFECKA